MVASNICFAAGLVAVAGTAGSRSMSRSRAVAGGRSRSRAFEEAGTLAVARRVSPTKRCEDPRPKALL